MVLAKSGTESTLSYEAYIKSADEVCSVDLSIITYLFVVSFVLASVCPYNFLLLYPFNLYYILAPCS